VAFAVLATSGCASAGYIGSAYGAGGGFGRRDERQIIGSYADVRALGISRRYVYAGTPSGIAVYDRVLNAWLPPFSRELGFGDDRITALAGDPIEDALWYGVPGAIVQYRPATEQLQRTSVVGVPELIVFERGGTGDALVRASGAWTRISRVGIATPLVGAPPAASVVAPTLLGDVYEKFPALRSGAGLVLRDDVAASRGTRALRNVMITSGTISPERPSEVWLGTNGDGLYRVDPTFQQSTPLRFGPMETGVGAIALAADGVWTAGLGQSPTRSGLSFGSNDLQRWRWVEGTISVPMIGVRAQAMSLRSSRAWIATDRGVMRVVLGTGDAFRAWSTLDGLPDARVYAVAARDDGAWVGTARGLAFVAERAPDAARAAGDVAETASLGSGAQGVTASLLTGTSVYALQAIGDTLWAGTSAGLTAISMSRATVLGGVAVTAGQSGDPALRRAVRALAWSDSVLIAITDDAALSIVRGRVERVASLDPRAVGDGARLAMDERAVVMTGTDGVVVMIRNTGVPRLLRVPSDIPAPVLDVAMSRDWLWLATPEGIVRFRRAADGGVY
jgi:hypothetical protein